MIGKIIKISLIGLAAILCCLLVAGVVMAMDWPWWTALFILTGISGLVLAGLFLRQKWLNYREKHFVQQIISQEERPFMGGGSEQDRDTNLKSRWTDAMNELKRSRLKEYGNPLYVLPWYMVMGESGSGKTTAIESAGLNSQFAQINRVSGLSGTKNCDWWFFEEAIILDTAGRYAVPVDNGRDKDEWQTFLSHLVKYRKREPINGLIITIPVDTLLQSTMDAVEAYGQTIRKRIAELMVVLGASFPIHVMVTKCDLIKGMTEFCDRLPEKSLNQTMGLLNGDRSQDALTFTDKVIRSIGDRLRDLRLILSGDSTTTPSGYGLDPAFLLFPEEFQSLHHPLNAFIKGAFLENPYQESPFLRGIFFSSGKQEGTPYSHFLKELGIIEKQNVLKESRKGLFLHDYFAQTLPRERELYLPTKRALEVNRFTKNLWLSAYIAIVIALCGLLSFSFMKNVRCLNTISHEMSETTLQKGDALSHIIILDRFRNAILDVTEQNKNWWIPRLGLNESKHVEADLKQEYCRRFDTAFRDTLFTKQLIDRMTGFNKDTPDDVIGDHIVYLVRRINLIEKARQGGDMDTLRRSPQPDCTVLFPGQAPIPEVMAKLQDLYLYHLYWGREITDLSPERAPLQTWLTHLVNRENMTMNWITAWINKTPDVKGLSLEDFWGGSKPGPADGPGIPGAFTLAGKATMESFLQELETALPDPLVAAGKKMAFARWYTAQYTDNWYRFGTSFDAGRDTLADEEAWRAIALKMPTPQGPYFLLFSRMATELAPVVKDAPAWLAMVNEFNTIRHQGEALRQADSQQGLASLTSTGKSIVNKIRRVRKESGESTATLFNNYMDALTAIAAGAPSQQLMYKLGEKTYTEDPVTSESPFWLAKNGVDVLRATMKTDTSDKMLRQLMEGPLDFLWRFTLMQTGCQLQATWEKQVLSEIQGITDQRTLNDMLGGKDGLAARFISGPAQPFLTRDRAKGYQARIILGHHVDFSRNFLKFSTRSDRAPKVIKDNYTVTIKGLPTDVNDKARLKPHATLLELQCGDEVQELRNLNYPVRKIFKWSPENCGDVILKISVGQLTLEKKYTGYPQFSKFLREFSQGYRTFRPNDFPDHQAALKRIGITQIVVKYRFSGNWPVIKLLDMASGSAPEVIAACWDS